jgi:2-oxo-4-hydroxy-4-carboxy-5-ureidoimidazoline decarboxylase
VAAEPVATLPSIAELEAAGAAAVREALEPLFERAPLFLDRVSEAGPFGSWARLFEHAETIALAMPERDQVELLDAHPRIGAPPGTMSSLSYREQGCDRKQADAIEALGRLNDAYEARFGFRYVIFVAGRPRLAIVPLLEAALAADRSAELARGLRDVVAIARDRARKLGADIEEVVG